MTARETKRKQRSKHLRPGQPTTPEMQLLPTMQRNALRKLFERPEFTPMEVLAVGYYRLQQAEGIGEKGLQIISAWLLELGYQLKRPEPDAEDALPIRTQKKLETAMRLLRTHGYVVQAGDYPEEPDSVLQP